MIRRDLEEVVDNESSMELSAFVMVRRLLGLVPVEEESLSLGSVKPSIARGAVEVLR